MITINSKSAAGANVTRLMPAASQQPLTNGNQKPPGVVQKVPSQQASLIHSSVNSNVPVPSPVNTVISIPNVVKPEVETKQEGTCMLTGGFS